jgi:hypothetical protein
MYPETNTLPKQHTPPFMAGLLIDACQSGGVDNDRLVRSLMDTNAFVSTSSRGNELSQDVPRITGGAQNPKAYSLGFYDFPVAHIGQ